MSPRLEQNRQVLRAEPHTQFLFSLFALHARKCQNVHFFWKSGERIPKTRRNFKEETRNPQVFSKGFLWIAALYNTLSIYTYISLAELKSSNLFMMFSSSCYFELSILILFSIFFFPLVCLIFILCIFMPRSPHP